MGLYTFDNMNFSCIKTWSSPCNILPKENCSLNILKCVENLFTNEKETITKNYYIYFCSRYVGGTVVLDHSRFLLKLFLKQQRYIQNLIFLLMILSNDQKLPGANSRKKKNK